MTERNKESELQALREFTGDPNVAPIELDDTFEFKCQRCGRCCMHREDIILNPFDIYNGAKYLGISTQDFITQYTYPSLGGHSKIPMVLLTTTANGYCPLLELDVKDGGKFKCKINPAKPGACSNHPIGITRIINKETNVEELGFIKVSHCANSTSDEQHTVREWVQPYMDHLEEIKYAHRLQYMITDYFSPREFCFLVNLSKDTAEAHNDEQMLASVRTLMMEYVKNYIMIAYGAYDINKPFIEQAEENIKALDAFLTSTKQLVESMTSCLEEATGQTLHEIMKENNFEP